MSVSSSEAQARITVNKLLEEAGWRFLPDVQGRRENIICEHRVTRRVFSPSQDLGKDFEHAPDGFVDYVLLDSDGRAVALVEAKREGIDPLTAKEQARAYAERLGLSCWMPTAGCCWSRANLPPCGRMMRVSTDPWHGSQRLNGSR